jgi:hypothetical protein
MLRAPLILIFTLVCALFAKAQVSDDLKNATWVRIMQNDTSVNYFVAKKDFEKFRVEHRKVEAQKQAQEKKAAGNNDHRPNELHLEDPEEAAIMAFQLWSKSIRPFVGNDGKVMPIKQRMAIVNRRK